MNFIIFFLIFFLFYFSSIFSHPIYNELCESYLSEISAYGNNLDVQYTCYFPIIQAEIVKKDEIIESIKNLFDHSHGLHNPSTSNSNKIVNLKNVIVFDDNLSEKASSWSDWSFFKEEELNLLKILRTESKLGSIKGKNFAVDYIKQNLLTKDCNLSNSFLIFLDEPALLSEYYAYALSLSLAKNERKSKIGTIAYPAIDIIYPKNDQFNIIKGNDLVAGFTWDFTPRWESLNNRIGIVDEDNQIEQLSPSFPPVFAIAFSHYNYLGGFDESIYPSPYFHENIDIAIRTWICGGSVVRQACSRASMKFNFFPYYGDEEHPENLFEIHQREKNSFLNFQQKEIDLNINLLALRYLHFPISSKFTQYLPVYLLDDNDLINNRMAKSGLTFSEFSYYKRFSNKRIPYRINSPSDFIKNRPPESAFGFFGQFHPRKNDNLLFCTTFEWYLQEVYPGLLTDIGPTAEAYNYNIANINSYYYPFYKFHYKSSPSLTTFLTTKSNKEIINLVKNNELDFLNIKNIPYSPKSFVPPPDTSINKFNEHMTFHQNLVRNEKVCKDINSRVNPDYCETMTNGGDQDKCAKNKASILLLCPDTCNWCDDQNNFCEDLYLQKCPTFAAQGKCDTEDNIIGKVKEVCKKSCKTCTQRTPKKKVVEKVENSNDYKSAFEPVSHAQETDFEQLINAYVYSKDDIENKALLFSPDILHNRYINGDIKDEFPEAAVGKDLCRIRLSDNRYILDKIEVNKEFSYKKTPKNHVKIFCAIYTYHKSHENKLKATYMTWGKKCDGFMAFSDLEDPLNYAHPINHKGEEIYDNMWQKSRSIWQFIFNKFSKSYDYFLIGGDDMFYIIENLRAYLNSREIVEAQKNSNGLYLGNAFYPHGLKINPGETEPFVFTSGGAGYILDQKALQALGEDINNNSCFPNLRVPTEDVQVGICLKRRGITVFDTRDKLKEERFHPFTPESEYHVVKGQMEWYDLYKPEVKYGLESCSKESVSFHYMSDKLIYQTHNYLYHCTSKST